MMTIALPSELEEIVNAKIQSGQYSSSGEVIRAGLQLLNEQDTLRQIKLEHLRKDISVGVEQADRGDLAPLDAEDIIRRGMQQTGNSGKAASRHAA